MDSKIYTVSSLNLKIKNSLESGFSNIGVEGEVSNFHCHNNRHLYFDLKDDNSKIKVVMFYEAKKKLGFEIEDGLHVLLSGYISVYEKRGDYQLIALDAEPVGKGSLALAYEQLKAKLKEKGYFEEIYKKAIPAIPKAIGLVTSTGGAVIRDIITVLSKRFENFHLVVRNVSVQGLSASREICEAIDDLCEFDGGAGIGKGGGSGSGTGVGAGRGSGVDVIILARGGGSLEDLWAFNTREVAQKVFECSIPVISAIGHETDFTICDFVADIRAATPSVAAQMVICDKIETIKKINSLLDRIKNNLEKNLAKSRQDLRYLADRRIFKKPQTILLNFWQGHDAARKKLADEAKFKIQSKKTAFGSLQILLSEKPVTGRIALNKMSVNNDLFRLFSGEKNKLESLKNRVSVLLKDMDSKSPVSVLQKGFALVLKKDNDKIIRSIDDADVDEQLQILLKDGILLSKILEKISKNPKAVD
jgi:exodeoxyribonuclease VII large subunit